MRNTHGRVAVALFGSMLLAGVTVGCTQKAEIDPAQMARIEGAASKSEAAASRAEAAAKAAADAATRAQAAADKAASMLPHKFKK
ncbi:MAG: hypothetical protein HYR72_18190 [Deltaproteobacteria bacterium]|nr:hypothetical protein [Deltaproteobacteria bacterium]MBI3386349.1 hypothetical protein [Deltaproteobacteria bacterium]